MSTKTASGIIEIICDKCGEQDWAFENDQGELVRRGWTANFRAKKYVHLCINCQPRRRMSYKGIAIRT